MLRRSGLFIAIGLFAFSFTLALSAPTPKPKPRASATTAPTPKASAKPSGKPSGKPSSPRPSPSPNPPIYRDVNVVLCVGQSVNIYEKEALQGLLPPVVYGPLVPNPPGSNVASARLHNTMTSEATVTITGNSPGQMTFTQEIDWPTGIQNPHQQYQKYVMRFHVTVRLCPQPRVSGRVARTPAPQVSEGPGTPPSQAPSAPPPSPPAGGMEEIHAKPHNVTLCVGQSTSIYEPEPMQGLLPDAEYGPLNPQNSSIASTSMHNTMSSSATVVITGLSPGQVTFTQEVLWPTGVMNPRQQYVKIIVTFNVTVRRCPTPTPRPVARALAVTNASSAYERGGPDNGEFTLVVRGADARNARVLVDGVTSEVDTLSISGGNVVARLHDDIALGRHTIAVESDGVTSTRFPMDVVSVRLDPVPPSDVGQVQTVTAHVEGIPPGDNGVAEFAIGGPVQILTGGTTANVPIENGIARVQIRRTAPGATTLRVHVSVTIR